MFNFAFLLNERDQTVCDECNPNLIHDRFFACAVEGLNLNVLLHPLKERFDRPSAAIHLTDFISGWLILFLSCKVECI